jgi:hypothetical protein
VDSIADPEAIASVKERMRRIATQIELAEKHGQIDEAQALDMQLAELAKHLSSYRGLGGRERRFSEEDEKCRKRVTAAIRTAKRTIRRTHPKLGEHLDKSVKTGMICSYEPPAELHWVFEVSQLEIS